MPLVLMHVALIALVTVAMVTTLPAVSLSRAFLVTPG
jgi:hypothetical protein